MIGENHAENNPQRNDVSLADTFWAYRAGNQRNRLVLLIEYALFDLCKECRHFYSFRYASAAAAARCQSQSNPTRPSPPHKNTFSHANRRRPSPSSSPLNLSAFARTLLFAFEILAFFIVFLLTWAIAKHKLKPVTGLKSSIEP